jgi:hypothetical protein
MGGRGFGKGERSLASMVVPALERTLQDPAECTPAEAPTKGWVGRGGQVALQPSTSVRAA